MAYHQQKFVTVMMANRAQDDAGKTPVVMHVMGPGGGTKVYACLTLEATKELRDQLARAIDAIERETADAKYAEAIR